MSDDARMVVASIIFLAFAAFVGWVGYLDGKTRGRIQVASGQYQCVLIENDDKTTRWKCEQSR